MVEEVGKVETSNTNTESVVQKPIAPTIEEVMADPRVDQISSAKSLHDIVDIKGESEPEIKLPSEESIVDKVRSFADPNTTKEYIDACTPLYDVSQNPPMRIGLMDYVHPISGTDQNISNIGLMDQVYPIPGTNQSIFNMGIQHDRNPDSIMNQKLSQRVASYIENTPHDQVHIILEGYNFPDPVPVELQGIYNTIKQEFLQKQEESEDDWYKRLVGRMGEQGVGAFHALKNGFDLDFHAELPQSDEFQAFRDAGIRAADIAALNIPKELDIFKSTNEFPEGFTFTQDQLYDSIAKMVQLTGWRKDKLDEVKKDPDKMDSFIHDSIAEINSVFRKEKGIDIISLDYKPLYPYANALTNPDVASTTMRKMFNVGNDARNRYIAHHTYDMVRQGKSPLLTFGDSHTFAVDPAFQYMSQQAA